MVAVVSAEWLDAVQDEADATVRRERRPCTQLRPQREKVLGERGLASGAMLAEAADCADCADCGVTADCAGCSRSVTVRSSLRKSSRISRSALRIAGERSAPAAAASLLRLVATASEWRIKALTSSMLRVSSAARASCSREARPHGWAPKCIREVGGGVRACAKR